MAQFWLPGDSDFAKAARGWPSSPRDYPIIDHKIDWNHWAMKKPYLVAGLEINGGAYRAVSKGQVTTFAAEDNAAGGGLWRGIPYHSGNNARVQFNNHIFAPASAGNYICGFGVFGSATDTPDRQQIEFNTSLSQGCEFRFPTGGSVLVDADVNSESIWSNQTILSTVNRGDLISVAFRLSDNSGVGCIAVVTNLTTGESNTLTASAPSVSWGSVEDRALTWWTGRTSQDWDIVIGGGFVWESYFSDEQLSSLSKAPWQIYEPANDTPFLISVPAGGGTPTLSSPGVINVQSDRATPQVTLTF